MGLAMAEQLINAGHQLLTLSRHSNPQLTARAAQRGTVLEQWTIDLADGAQAATRLRHWLAEQNAANYSAVQLINNAASLAGMGPLREAAPADLATGLRVGLEAPMQLCAVFLAATEAWAMPRKILNISSGLGRRAMASAANYCAIKAGLDHLTRCLALEEALKVNGAKVCSLAPGVIATDMQVQLRNVPADKFPDRGNFIAMHQQGILASPADAAKAVLDYLARTDFGKDAIADVRG